MYSPSLLQKTHQDGEICKYSLLNCSKSAVLTFFIAANQAKTLTLAGIPFFQIISYGSKFPSTLACDRNSKNDLTENSPDLSFSHILESLSNLDISKLLINPIINIYSFSSTSEKFLLNIMSHVKLSFESQEI
ncbi:hypothetical protein LguiA_008240 [Lonicera macranthoides]